MQKWIDELVNEYTRIDTKGNKILPVIETRITRIFLEFCDYPDSVMDSAVNAYTRENRFFPYIIDLAPYVEMAKYDKPTGVRRVAPLPPFGTDLGILADADPAAIKSFTDEQRYEIELARGTMRPLSEIETEIDAARIQLKEMRA